jgi:hypothetical protein
MKDLMLLFMGPIVLIQKKKTSETKNISLRKYLNSIGLLFLRKEE